MIHLRALILLTLVFENIYCSGKALNCEELEVLNKLLDYLGKTSVVTIVPDSKSCTKLRFNLRTRILGKLGKRLDLVEKTETLVVLGNVSAEEMCRITLQHDNHGRQILVKFPNDFTKSDSCELTISSNLLLYKIDHDMTLFEVYKAHPGDPIIKMNHLVTLSKDGSLTYINRVRMWERRSDLDGKMFSASTGVFPPWVTLISRNPTTKFIQPLGIFPTLTDVLSKNLNMSVSYKTVYTSWKKMVREVGNGIYDFGGTGFTFSGERKSLVEFSTPVFRLQWKFFTMNLKNNIKFTTFGLTPGLTTTSSLSVCFFITDYNHQLSKQINDPSSGHIYYSLPFVPITPSS